MTQLWPRLNPGVAQALFMDIVQQPVRDLAISARDEHPQATFAATGGTRVAPATVTSLAKSLRDTAGEFGYPDQVGDAEKVRFDRAAAEALYSEMELTAVEAAHRGVWSFLALVVAPDLVQWRFRSTYRERWVAADLTRHMFSRLWWQALTFAVPIDGGTADYTLLRQLSESDLNAITERRSLAGNPRLAQALARLITSQTDDVGRRALIRGITPRLRRRLAFMDFASLTDEQLDDHLRALVHETRDSWPTHAERPGDVSRRATGGLPSKPLRGL